MYYQSFMFTPPGGFTFGIEGPACDWEGNLYAVNYAEQHTIGKVTSEGECSTFVKLENGSIGNGIRFNSKREMLIADYTNHNILKVDMKTKKVMVFAHEDNMNQPNDICITSEDIVFASDPCWKEETGKLWRVLPDGKVDLMEENMGTTNGIEVSPDEKTLYVNESRQRNIWAYDLKEGRLFNKRLFYSFEDYQMDGMRCDREGNLYVTRYGKGTVIILSPEGKPIREIYLGGKKCSNIAFGGSDGKTCYVTLADTGNIQFFYREVPGRSFELYNRKNYKK